MSPLCQSALASFTLLDVRAVRSNQSFLIIGALAVLLPAGALAYLQFRALVDLEAETKMAIRESLRRAIREHENEIERRLHEIAQPALERLATIDPDPDDPARLTEELGQALAASSGIDQVALARLYQGDRFGAVVNRDSAWLEEVEAADDWPMQSVAIRSRVPWHGKAKISYYQKEGTGEWNEFATSRGLYAFAWLEGGLRAGVRIPRSELLQLVRKAISTRPAGKWESLGAPEFQLVNVSSGEPVDPAAASQGKRVLREPLGEPLRSWSLAAVYTGPSIADTARESYYYNLATLAAVLAALGFGVVLWLRAVSRQARLAEMRASFVSNVSHEMRTPLSLIALYAETLKLGRVSDPEQTSEFQDVIYRESKRLMQMVNNVLDFSRIESGREKLKFEPSRIGDIIAEVVNDYREPMQAAGFEVKTEISSDLPEVMADRAALSQALLNLLDNAVKYSPEEKSITVRARRRGAEVAIDVEDRGVGIPAAEQSRIFEQFHRVENPLTPETRGSGLGLALAKHTAEAHGGRIELDSEPGRGSRFTIVLPAAEEATATIEEAPFAVPNPSR